MKNRYEEKVQNMIQYYQNLKKAFIWEQDMVKHVVALTYAMKDKVLDLSQIKDMKDYIKTKTEMFSPFRGHMMFALSGLLCAASDTPKAKFDFMVTHEKTLKTVGFKNASYLPIALYALTNINENHEVTGYVEKAMLIYKEMKHNHPFLTSGDDYALAILLAGTDHSPQRLEDYYQALNERGFSKSNGLQALSHIMAFSDKQIKDAVDYCERIYVQLKEHKLKLYPDYYSAIGLVSLLDMEQNELMTDLIEVASYLKNHKKYMFLGKGMNILIASGIIASEYIKEKSYDMVISSTLSVSIQAIIAAQQVAIITAASTAAAVSTT